jgi:dienelactone hydrolase
MKNKCLLLLCALFLASSASRGATMDQAIEPKPDDNFTEARFRLWLPEKVQQVRGVFVLVPWYQRDGLNQVDEPRWQQLATKWNFGLLGCTLRGKEEAYYLADKGTGRALLEALAKLAVQAKHPELKDAPIALWGHSAGGQFSYNFTAWAPERVIAFVATKGGYYHAATDARSRSVPALFFIGEKDENVRVQSITEVFQTNRRQGAVWCLAVEPNEGHGIGKTLDLALAFFDAVVPLRLPANGSHTASLRSVDQIPAWLGNLSSYEIASAASYSQPVNEAAWLPDEVMAQKWKDFVERKDLVKGTASTAATQKITPTVMVAILLVAGLIILTVRKPLRRLLPKRPSAS